MGRNNIGNVTFVTFPLEGSDVDPSAAIPASALQFAFSKSTSFGLAAGATPVTGEYEVHVANNVGTVLGFHAKVTVPGSSASVTVDLKKNGTSILSAPITLTNATGAGTPQNATISTPSLAAGDRLTALLTVSSSTGMTGVSAWVNGVEISQPL